MMPGYIPQTLAPKMACNHLGDGERCATRGWRALCDTVLVPLGLYVALFLILLLTSHTALAQTGSGRIAASVKDASGAVIPGSKVAW
jgi:hypothetical protein